MRIFFDVDTQNDFMNKDGALYVPDAELLKPTLKDLTEYARQKNVPIIGSVDKHFGTEEYKAREGELARWGGPFPDHCMAGKRGQRKIKETGLFDWVPWDTLDPEFDFACYVPHDLQDKVNRFQLGYCLAYAGSFTLSKKPGPVCFEKQSYDVFTNPAVEVFLKMADVKEAVVYGVATDYCVKAAVLGMQQRGIQTYVVEDAIKGVFPDGTKAALEEMAAAGAKFVTVKQVLEGRV